MRRRNWVCVLATLGVGASFAHAALPNGVAVGDVTGSSAVLWARSDTAGNVNFQISTTPTFAGGTAATVTDPLVPAKTSVTGLIPGTQYFYRATDAAGAATTGSFRTPASSGRVPFRMGVTGDWRGDVMPYPGIRNAPARNLDLLVKLGDTVYQDIASPANGGIGQSQTLPEFRNKHAEVLSTVGGINTLAAVRGSTAVLSTIDDHEVTNDFEGFEPWEAEGTVGNPFSFGSPALGTRKNRTPLYQNGLQSFHEYMPIESRTYTNTGSDARTDGLPELYRARTYGQTAGVIVTDARSFRDPGLPAPANITDPVAVGNYIAATYTPGRTMLGGRQLSQIQADLLAMQASGVTWKFINVAEPIQNLGVLNASDRFEGYAAERSQLLGFIEQAGITNVVFVAADIHGTLVNDLQYGVPAPGGGLAQRKINAFEITTGSLGFAAPFGPTVAGIAAALSLPGALPLTTYNALPRSQQEAYITGLINAQVLALGYNAVGLQDSTLNGVQLLQGGYSATNTYGWTEFDIDPITQALTVTTYGVPWYESGATTWNGIPIADLQPTVVSQFRVLPIPEPTTLTALAGVALLTLRRRAGR
jgi:alkaline phosphatase D